MKYRINALGNLVDEFNSIILEDCPLLVKSIFKDFQDSIDKLEDSDWDKDQIISDLKNKNNLLKLEIKQLNSDIKGFELELEELYAEKDI